MSRAFVKEQDGNFPDDDIAELPQTDEPNYVTPGGLAQLRAKHHALQEKHGALAASAADDPVQRPALRQLERDLHFLAGRLERAVLVEPAAQPADEVRFGAEVTVEDEKGQPFRFFIVGQDEADIAVGKVSWASPLARAMMGAKVGDVVDWQRPAGASRLEVTAIRYPS
jgi:transcription elongation GreA/GreB family factor